MSSPYFFAYAFHAARALSGSPCQTPLAAPITPRAAFWCPVSGPEDASTENACVLSQYLRTFKWLLRNHLRGSLSP